MVNHVRGMYDLLVGAAGTGRQPWARLHDEGHADYWGRAWRYLATNRDMWSAALVTDETTG
ncbi:MAG: aminoglycoside phosphotransferase family protein, partial [Stackebrandtia sp.]